jgi:lysophospholipase L1-like esterase
VQRAQTPPPQTGSAPARAQPPLDLADATLRQIVHVSIGGSRARVVFSNTFGMGPLAIGAASVALRDSESNIVKNSAHPLTFGGSAAVTIPSGATMISDPVSLAFPPMSDLAIDLYLSKDMLPAASPLTTHGGAYQTNYISKPGNFAGSAELPVATTVTSWFFLSRVETTAPAAISAIICFGDSITDGTASTRNANSRWPDLLAKRLAAKSENVRAIDNEAIAGNRLLTESVLNFGINALSRFDRDVLAVPGATHMIVLEAINDIGMGRGGAPAPSAAELIAAQQQLIDRAHAHGLKIIGATLTPFEGAAYFTADGETKRQAINTWIRTGKGGPTTNSAVYDGVIDFDAATRDPQTPTKFNPQFDSGDHLHPNDAGYQAMANAIDLKLFESGGKHR